MVKTLYITLYLLSQLSSWSDNFIKDVFSHVGINSTERIIQQVNISIKIHWTSQAYSLFLPTTQVNALIKVNQLYCFSILVL